MQRQIKFRIWSNDANKFIPSDLDRFFVTMDGKIALVDDFGDTPSLKIFKESYGVIQQYTGLKDKNGVEIYEGDILPFRKKLLDSNINYKWYKYNGVVTCNDKLACYELRYNNENSIEGLSYWAGSVEVIGNIHENPELLKKSGTTDLEFREVKP